MSTATLEAPRKQRTRKRKASSAEPPKPDPTTEYARAVVDGTIVAGRAVRQAGARHLQNLDDQRTVAFPYYWDLDAANNVIEFFPAFLTLEDGSPFNLPPWLQFSYGFIFGWKVWGGDMPDGTSVADMLHPEHVARAGFRRIQHGFFETSKGSGKTPSAGGVGLYGISMDDEPYAQVYSTGFDEGQASIILNDGIRMANGSEDLRDELLIGKANIAHPQSGSFFRAMSSQHRSKSGPRPHYVLSDEIHEHRDGTVVTKAEAGFKGRKQPLGLKFTNSGSDKTSYCWELHEKSLNILEGRVVDEQWFAYVCHLDPCQEHYDEGFRQPKDDCPNCDDWKDQKHWPKVAPALGIVIQPKYLQDAVDAALSIPSEYNIKRRLNFCIWTETHQVWISSDRWESCRVPSVRDANPDGLACAAGLDPSSVLDLTALVVAIRHEDPPPPPGAATAPAEEVVIEGKDETGEAIKLVYKLNFTVELVPYFWVPQATINERTRRERIPYDQWARLPEGNPFLKATPGAAIDHDAVYDFFVHDVYKRFKVQRLGMDENHGRYLFMKIRDQGRLGDKIISVGQGKKLSEAYKFIEILIAHKRLRHAGHPVLTWNFANAEPQKDRVGALWIEKPDDPRKRVDGVVATAMAIHQLMTLKPRKKSGGVFLV